jgi:multiple sugar transport system permease protein
VGPLSGRLPIAVAAGRGLIVAERNRSALPPARRVPPPAVRRRRMLASVANHSMAITLSIIFLAPFVFVVLTALMTREQALSTRLWPRPFEWSNFKEVFHLFPLWTYALNTFMYAGLSTIGVVVSSVPVAYALSRMRWRGRQAVFLVVLSTLMLPTQVTIVPLYVIFVRLHWIGSLKPLIIPSFFGDAFAIFLLRQFFLTIPQELSDAARVDGAGEFQIMTRVIVPLAKSGIAAVALFQFLYAWNDFFNPLVFSGNNPNSITLAVALSQLVENIHVHLGVLWNVEMAASVLFMLPVILIFFFAQKAFIEGVTLTGVKG